MFQYTDTKNAPGAIGPYSQAILSNGFLYASGQIPINPETGNIESNDIAEQTEQVCKNISGVLEANGLTFDNVIKTTCYLAEISDFAVFNEVYAKYFTSKPARSCVAVKDIPKGALCEIEIIAVVNP